MAQLAAGSETAVEELMSRYRERVIRLAVRALGDRGRAEDVVQETFLRVVKHAPSYDGRGQFLGWLLTIASRLSLNASRDRWRRLEVPLESASGRPTSTSPEHSLASRELWEALRRLRPRYRMALVLKAVEGLSYGEIARILECSESDVANAVFRARRALARALGRSG